jgi:hypothetical protein
MVFDDIEQLLPYHCEFPEIVTERTSQMSPDLTFGNTYDSNNEITISQTDFLIKERDDYMQSTIKKDIAVKEWLLKDQKLNAFSSNVIREVDSIFRSTSSVEAYSIELVKEDIPGLEDDLTMYIKISKKVTKAELMDLWKRISAKSVETIRKITNNQNEFEEMLEKTTITLRHY